MKKTSIQPLSQEQFEDHLKNEHRLSPFSTYLREITFGGSDGIVTTFAVVAGFAGATGGQASAALPLMTVLIFGWAIVNFNTLPFRHEELHITHGTVHNSPRR